MEPSKELLKILLAPIPLGEGGGSATFGVLLSRNRPFRFPQRRVSTISTPKVAMPNHNGKPNFGGVKRDLELNPFNNLPKNIGQEGSLPLLRVKTPLFHTNKARDYALLKRSLSHNMN